MTLIFGLNCNKIVAPSLPRHPRNLFKQIEVYFIYIAYVFIMKIVIIIVKLHLLLVFSQSLCKPI